MESKKINQLATELAPDLTDLTIIGDPITGISKKITLSQMASLFTGTVEEYANKAAFPLVGVADTIYVALDTNVIWRWNTGTSAYVELSPNIINSLVFGDGSGFDGTISLVGSVATLTITTALTTGSVGFIGASGALLEDNANFFWNNTTKRLGINTNAPTTALDVFGSGIIGRLNGTSTNNAFLGFASVGTNRWSIGNVQSDNRFRIYNEATTSELVSILSTGEFGIGIANPLTKFHIFSGASALIANLDANTSVAKSISYRSGNSSRINLEVSGTESGSNAGMDFFLRTYADAGSLLETPFSIVRSTGVTTIKSLTLTNALSVANGGTGAATFTTGRVLFGNGTSALNTSANLFWDNTNNRLGINQGTPLYGLDLTGTFRIVTPNRSFFVTTNAYSISDGTLSSGIGMDGSGLYLGNVTSSTGWTIANPQLTILTSGYVGINIITPITPLHIAFDNNDSDVGQLWITGKTTTTKRMSLGYNTTGNYSFISSYVAAGGYKPLCLNPSGGNVTIGTITAGYDGSGYGAIKYLTINNSSNTGTSLELANGTTANDSYIASIDFINTSNTGAPGAGRYGIAWIRGYTTNASATTTGGGYISIGTKLDGGSSSEKLRIGTTGDIIATVGAFRAYNTFYGISNSTGSAPYGFFGRKGSATGSGNDMAIFAEGGLGIYTYTNGTISPAGPYVVSGGTSWTNGSSDIRKKKNFETTQGLAEILQIEPIKYHFNEDDDNSKKRLGFKAQNLLPIIPEMVLETGEIAEDGSSYLTVTPDFILPVLVKAIQELKAELDELKAKIK